MGKLSWLANSTCPVLSYTALSMSKKNTFATISDLRDVSRILKKVRERSSKLKSTKIGEKEGIKVDILRSPIANFNMNLYCQILTYSTVCLFPLFTYKLKFNSTYLYNTVQAWVLSKES